MKLLGFIFYSLIFFSIIITDTTEVETYNTGIYIKYTDTCVENLNFKSNYLRSIIYIEAYVEGRKTSKQQFGNCIDNMIKNSGIRSSVYYGYIFRYRKKSDFYSDKRKWLQWYEKHKCNNLQWKHKTK